ncbi:MAG: hypothetical protein IJ730_00080 [Alphaproteobacteria bacterium]|nr:hypothetical protein [Alphaproteobacteria bacterium]
MTNILFVHCFRRSYPLEKTFKTVRNQFDRRIERLQRHLKKSKNILLVYVSKKDNYSDDYLITYQQQLAALYPKCNIELYYILTVKRNDVYVEQRINERLRKIVMSYSTEDLESGKGEGNRWQGISVLFDKALKDVSILQHRLLKLVCRILSSLVPLKRLRLIVRNFWYDYYYR